MTTIHTHNYTQPLDFARSWARIVRGETPLPPTQCTWLDKIEAISPHYTDDMRTPGHPWRRALGGEYMSSEEREACNALHCNQVGVLSGAYAAAIEQINAVIPKSYQLHLGLDYSPEFDIIQRSYTAQVIPCSLGADRPRILLFSGNVYVARRKYRRRRMRSAPFFNSSVIPAAIETPEVLDIPLIMAARTLVERHAPHYNLTLPFPLREAAKQREARKQIIERVYRSSVVLAERDANFSMLDLRY